MPDYRNLLFVAMDNGQEEIATRLIHLGADCTMQQLVSVGGGVFWVSYQTIV